MAKGRKDLPDWTKIDWDSVDLEELMNIPSEETIAAYHTFTPEFEERMEKMFEKAGIPLHAEAKTEPENAPVGAVGEAREENRKGVKKAAKTGKRHGAGFRILVASACFLIVISVGTIAAFQSEAVPHIVIEVFQEWYDDFVKVTWGSNQKESMKLEVREPGYLPEGYELVEKEESPNFYVLIYENEKGGRIEIWGRAVVSGALRNEDIEDFFIEECEIGGIICEISQMQDGRKLGEWEQNGVMYRVFAPISKDGLKNLVETMIEK